MTAHVLIGAGACVVLVLFFVLVIRSQGRSSKKTSFSDLSQGRRLRK